MPMLSQAPLMNVNAHAWLSRIHRRAAETLVAARAEGQAVELHIPAPANDGIFCIIPDDLRVTIYVAVPPGEVETAVLPTSIS